MSSEREIRVLIVEDQPIQAMELEALAHDAGYRVIGCAQDAQEALALAQCGHPDLALIDMNLLDGHSGPEIAARLAETEGAAAIFVTANPETAPMDRDGVIGVISKPYDDKAVNSALRYARCMLEPGARITPPPRAFAWSPQAAGGR